MSKDAARKKSNDCVASIPNLDVDVAAVNAVSAVGRNNEHRQLSAGTTQIVEHRICGTGDTFFAYI